ncbi:MAG TPA: lipoyl(octanoyl) transferase LipB [Mycobacteriales bacterium]|nr:lipoyl(octanoyl) transferase LipB [Mycobacteriales bacterium]
MELTCVRGGLVPYDEAWEWQRQLHARRVAGTIGDTCLLLEHPSVYTAGKRTEDDERPAGEVPVVDVDRGGKLTWHGPGQLVGYPIVSLEPVVDVVAHVRRVEEVLLRTCHELDVADATRVEGRSGVWVSGGASKVAAVGIRVARGVTTHGFALNCDPDLTAYDVIVPCGIRDAGVTSLSVLLGRTVSVDEVRPIVERHLAEVLGGGAVRAVVPADVGLAAAGV